MKLHSSNLQTLLGSFHADVWEVEEVVPYVQSLSDIDQSSLKQEMEKLIESKAVDSKFMRNFISDDFKSDKDALRFFKGVLAASFEGKEMPNIDNYID